MKRCTKCGVEKSLDDYLFHKKRNHFVAECRSCVSIRAREYILKNKDKVKQKVKENWKKYKDKYDEKHGDKSAKLRLERYKTIEGRTNAIFTNSKTRAKKLGIENSLFKEFVYFSLFMGKCQATGFKFDLHTTSSVRNPFAPSIDRKDNNKGYTIDNVQIVCSMYNMGKNEHDEIDFIAICMAVAEMNRNNQIAIDRLAELRNAARL